MRKILLSVAAVAALTSCVSSADEDVPTPAGQVVHQAKCNGSPNGCMKTAAKTCHGTYQVVDSSSNAGGLIADILPGPITWYRMSYQCGKSDGRMPTFAFRGQQYTPAPVVINQSTPSPLRTTNCNRYGNNVTCTSY